MDSREWMLFTNEFIERDKAAGIRYIIMCPIDTHNELYLSLAPGAYRVAQDKDGSIVMPLELRDYIGISEGGDIVFVGAEYVLQIWEANSYKDYRKREMRN